MTSPARVAADVAALLADTDPLGQLARRRLALAVRQEPHMTDQPIDSRDVEVVQIGAPLRDAAVDPHPGDFGAPADAGSVDPHSPDCVSKGIR